LLPLSPARRVGRPELRHRPADKPGEAGVNTIGVARLRRIRTREGAKGKPAVSGGLVYQTGGIPALASDVYDQVRWIMQNQSRLKCRSLKAALYLQPMGVATKPC
jgi:hypothetical protein